MHFNHNILTIMNFPSVECRDYCHSTKEDHMMNASKAIKIVLTSLLVFLAFSLSGTSVLAFESVREAQLIVREAQAICPELDCPESRVQVKALSRDESEKLPAETQKFLRVAAKSFAENLWPDTVLESPLEVEFRIRIDGLEILNIDQQAVGYRVLFSTVAWNTDECPAFTQEEMDQRSIKDLIKEKCQKGRVTDRAFAIPNPSGTFADESFFANFQVK